jgi:hypothetical protein
MKDQTDEASFEGLCMQIINSSVNSLNCSSSSSSNSGSTEKQLTLCPLQVQLLVPANSIIKDRVDALVRQLFPSGGPNGFITPDQKAILCMHAYISSKPNLCSILYCYAADANHHNSKQSFFEGVRTDEERFQCGSDVSLTWEERTTTTTTNTYANATANAPYANGNTFVRIDQKTGEANLCSVSNDAKKAVHVHSFAKLPVMATPSIYPAAILQSRKQRGSLGEGKKSGQMMTTFKGKMSNGSDNDIPDFDSINSGQRDDAKCFNLISSHLWKFAQLSMVADLFYLIGQEYMSSTSSSSSPTNNNPQISSDNSAKGSSAASQYSSGSITRLRGKVIDVNFAKCQAYCKKCELFCTNSKTSNNNNYNAAPLFVGGKATSSNNASAAEAVCCGNKYHDPVENYICKWECSCTFDDGSGQAKVYLDGEVCLQVIGLQVMKIMNSSSGSAQQQGGGYKSKNYDEKGRLNMLRIAIESAALCKENGVIFFRNEPLATSVKKARISAQTQWEVVEREHRQQQRRGKKDQFGSSSSVSESNSNSARHHHRVEDYMSTSEKGAYFMYLACQWQTASRLRLELLVRTIPLGRGKLFSHNKAKMEVGDDDVVAANGMPRVKSAETYVLPKMMLKGIGMREVDGKMLLREKMLNVG